MTTRYTIPANARCDTCGTEATYAVLVSEIGGELPVLMTLPSGWEWDTNPARKETLDGSAVICRYCLNKATNHAMRAEGV